ncbi:MAG: hypothetical protein U9P00_10845, partial [Pseudomonadota bacterium]|nr:hypothetical protein [Pseudomonadota bacterium]
METGRMTSWTGMVALCASLILPPTALAFQSQVPTGSGIQVIGVHPEPRNDPKPLVAHFPLANFLSFELDFVTPSMALTFDQGIVTYYDESGSAYRTETFGVADFDKAAIRLLSNPAGSGANIPMGERIVLMFPLEDLRHNEMPSALDVALCFDEFAGPNGACIDPVLFQDIVLFEYHVPAGQTYRYPTQTPAEPGERWWSGGAYELKVLPGGHRATLRRNDVNLTAWINQRYAWDIGVTRGNGATPQCDDGNGNS